MTLVDANVLVYAINRDFAQHTQLKAWWDDLLASGKSVGLPWLVILAFVRITTNRRVLDRPLSLEEALSQIDAWLALPGVSVLYSGPDHPRLFAECCRAANATGNLVSDAHLAALAIEHGCELASNDTDFGRFPGLRWRNPLVAV